MDELPTKLETARSARSKKSFKKEASHHRSRRVLRRAGSYSPVIFHSATDDDDDDDTGSSILSRRCMHGVVSFPRVRGREEELCPKCRCTVLFTWS